MLLNRFDLDFENVIAHDDLMKDAIYIAQKRIDDNYYCIS